MPDRKDRNPVQPWLSGWRAFLAIVGGGVLAAVVVVGLVVGLFRLLISGPSSSGGGIDANASWQPPEELGEGELNLCTKTVDTLGVATERKDSGSNYRDTGMPPDGSERVIEDECNWEIYSPEGDMSMTLTYKAVLDPNGEEASSLINSEERKERLNKAEGEFSKILDEGKLVDVGEDSYYFYGESNSEEREMKLFFVGGAPGGSYEIELEPLGKYSSGDRLPLSAFLVNIRKVAPAVQIDLERWVAY